MRHFRKKIYSHCSEVYPWPDCFRSQLFPREVGFVSSEKSFLEIDVAYNSGDDLIIEAKPGLKLLEYLIFTGSIISFWFGLTMMNLMESFKITAKMYLMLKRNFKTQNSFKIQNISNVYLNIAKKVKRSIPASRPEMSPVMELQVPQINFTPSKTNMAKTFLKSVSRITDISSSNCNAKDSNVVDRDSRVK